MNPSMGFSCGDAFDREESKVPLTDDESREARYRIGMDWHNLGVELVEMEFWPVEHPMEPHDEDRPVKCPMPDASVLNKIPSSYFCIAYIKDVKDGEMNEKRFSESLKKMAEVPAVISRESMVVLDEQPRVRAVRKRHHTLTHGEHIMTNPLMRMPPLATLPTQNITIFQMLQQVDKFESE